MRFASLLPVALAGAALAVYAPKRPNPSNNDAYIKRLDEVTSDVLLHKTTGVEAGLDVCCFLLFIAGRRTDRLPHPQPGVVSAVIPDPDFPEFSLYWLRDACLVYDMWLNRLMYGTSLLSHSLL